MIRFRRGGGASSGLSVFWRSSVAGPGWDGGGGAVLSRAGVELQSAATATPPRVSRIP